MKPLGSKPASTARGSARTLITGGAGFIGCNLALKLLDAGERVIIYDNFSRPGVDRNARYLRARYGNRVEISPDNICDRSALEKQVGRADSIFHFAAQVAVTSSYRDPVADFRTNIGGTLAMLEAARAQRSPIPVVFTSTNKVYGRLDHIALREEAARYSPADPQIAAHGICEDTPLDFLSPYGCSKGAADQYVREYGRTLGVNTVVLRMSCIYGPHQLGTEDQGWVAHFVRQALRAEPITIFGDGKQVRDLLYIDDLVEALIAARRIAGQLPGEVFNIGGSPINARSVTEVIRSIETLTAHELPVKRESWRPGDQRFYASDTAKFTRATGWAPRTSVEDGIRQLFAWLSKAPEREEQGIGQQFALGRV